MSKASKRIQGRKRYSEGFKKARVKDFESGTFSVLQMSRLYGIPANSLYSWIRRYTNYPAKTAIIMEVPNSQTEKVKQLQKKIAELEQALGRKQILIDYYQELHKVMKEDGIDVEKKSGDIKRSANSQSKRGKG